LQVCKRSTAPYGKVFRVSKPSQIQSFVNVQFVLNLCHLNFEIVSDSRLGVAIGEARSIFGFRIYIGILGGSLMVTEVQILANRRNAQKSTGPHMQKVLEIRSISMFLCASVPLWL
jgi:hypothetical protein